MRLDFTETGEVLGAFLKTRSYKSSKAVYDDFYIVTDNTFYPRKLNPLYKNKKILVNEIHHTDVAREHIASFACEKIRMPASRDSRVPVDASVIMSMFYYTSYTLARTESFLNSYSQRVVKYYRDFKVNSMSYLICPVFSVKPILP